MKKYIGILLLLTVLWVVPVYAHGGEDEALAEASRTMNSYIFSASILFGLTATFTAKKTRIREFTNRQYLIIALGTIAAIIHFGFGIREGDLLLILNGAGFLGFMGILFIPHDFFAQHRQLTRWALILYSLATIIGYFIVHSGGMGYEWVGLASQAIELTFGLLLFLQIIDKRNGLF